MSMDNLFNDSLASLVVEIASYSPNYDMMIWNMIQFDYQGSGLVMTSSFS